MQRAAHAGATFTALKPGLVGMAFQEGGPHARPDLLPAFRGFATALEFADNGMVSRDAPRGCTEAKDRLICANSPSRPPPPTSYTPSGVGVESTHTLHPSRCCQVDSYTPLVAPAPGMPCKEALRINADSCRITFGVIQDCETGVVVTTRTPVRTVM